MDGPLTSTGATYGLRRRRASLGSKDDPPLTPGFHQHRTNFLLSLYDIILKV